MVHCTQIHWLIHVNNKHPHFQLTCWGLHGIYPTFKHTNLPISEKMLKHPTISQTARNRCCLHPIQRTECLVGIWCIWRCFYQWGYSNSWMVYSLWVQSHSLVDDLRVHHMLKLSIRNSPQQQKNGSGPGMGCAFLGWKIPGPYLSHFYIAWDDPGRDSLVVRDFR